MNFCSWCPYKKSSSKLHKGDQARRRRRSTCKPVIPLLHVLQLGLISCKFCQTLWEFTYKFDTRIHLQQRRGNLSNSACQENILMVAVLCLRRTRLWNHPVLWWRFHCFLYPTPCEVSSRFSYAAGINPFALCYEVNARLLRRHKC